MADLTIAAKVLEARGTMNRNEATMLLRSFYWAIKSPALRSLWRPCWGESERGIGRRQCEEN